MYHPNFGGNPGGAGAGGFGAPGGFFDQLAGMQRGPPDPRDYDDYFKAYSTAMMASRSERANLVHGGKIIMPPSALARLTNMELESPWTFQLRNPKSAALETHAGVLEFIAEEGVVYLPPWMMKTLELREGDPLRVTGAKLPKGKRVKIQAQNLEFLEVSDPKAVLESCLRNFSCLTQGDIFSVSYNMISFEFLVMEVHPGDRRGISCQDTDLEVEFAVPKGYVEPKKPEPKPVATMASKLKIDVNSTAPSTRSASASGAEDAESAFEAFVGGGRTLNGRRTKGKGLQRSIEEVEKESKIFRTDKSRFIPLADLALGSTDKVPAALNLPPGHLFFGWTYKAFEPDQPEASSSATAAAAPPPAPFSGLSSGATLSGRAPRAFAPEAPMASASTSSRASPAPGATAPTPVPVDHPTRPASVADAAKPEDPWAKFSGAGGNTLSGKGKGREG